MSRADHMYRALRATDGRWLTRGELFRIADQFYLTNNAASEVRAKYGVQVEHKLIDGEHCYRLLSAGRAATVGSPPDDPPCAEQPGPLPAAHADPSSPCTPKAAGQLSLV